MVNKTNVPDAEDWKRTLDALPDLICTLDTEHKVLWMNAAMAKKLAVTQAEAKGLTCYEAVHGTTCPPDFCPHRQLILDQQEHAVEVHEDRLGGDFLVTCTPLMDKDGELAGSVHVARDITERKLADAALRESEERLRFSLESCHIGTWDVDLADNTAVRSLEHARIFGYEQLQPIWSLDMFLKHILPEDRVPAGDTIQRAIQTQSNFSYECRIRRVDGQVRWIWVAGRYRVDTGGKGRHLAGVVQDITDRKQAEEALAESEKRYRILVETANEGIWMMDGNHLTTYTNRAMEKMLGYQQSEMIGKKVEDFFFPEDMSFHKDKMAKRHAGVDEVYDRRLRCRDGSELWTTVSAKALFDEQRRFAGSFAMFTDITDRKWSEEALRTSESRYRQAQAIGHVGNWEYNIQTTQFWGSDEAKRIYGFDPAQSNFSTDEVEKCIPERERVHQALVDLIAADKPYNLEFEITPRNSSESRIIASIAELEHDEHGDPLRVVGVIQDITERKWTEEEKEKLQAQLSQSQKMESVGRLAGGVAHDFNNMLQAILGHAELALLKVGPNETLYADLKEIQKAAERSADLTRQLLAFARKQTVAPRVLDLNETVESMLKMLRRLIGEDIDLAWMPGSNLGPVFIDPSQMDQILANLCVNARDAIAGTGKITIETDSVSFDESYCADHAGFIPGEFVMLAVSDDGCGMDAGTLSHLFEPFFTTKDIGKGTGLGLATVYGAVRQNNGFINVYSEPGHGTTFKIYLPLYAAKAVPRLEQERDLAPETGGETILLVEDEPAILKMTTLMLESMSYAVIAAATPGEAIRLAREHTGRIDLLMTDVVMPEMNGRELAGNLISIYPDIRRLFMSGYTANVIAHQGVLDQGVHFIQKPFSMQGLSAKIREALNRE